MLSGLVYAHAATASQPYAGQDARPIKSLSASDVAALEAGQGWGFAKPAELNGIPGPLHVLELAEKLALSDTQRRTITGIFEAMRTEAQAAGRDFLKAERALDAAFASKSATPEEVEGLTEAAGIARSRVRAVHLKAHLATAPHLTKHQTHLYARLRGYGDDARANGTHGHHGKHKH